MQSHENIGESLISIVKAGQVDKLLSALVKGANPNETDEKGFTLLHHAIHSKQLDVLKLLLRYNVDMNKPDGHGITPLMEATIQNNGDAISLLLGAGANGKKEAMEYAIEYNYSAAQEAISCMTAQSLPQVNQHFLKHVTLGNVRKVEKYLKEKRINPNYISEDGKGYLIHALEALRSLPDNYESQLNINCIKSVITLLIEYDVNPNQQDAKGLTPLMLAAEHGCADIVETLLYKGANPNSKVANDITVLAIAADVGNREISELLIANGAQLISKENIGIAEFDGLLLQCFDESARTPAMCKAAVEQNRLAMQFVPEARQTKKLCDYAVVNYGVIKYIKNAELRQSYLDKAYNDIKSKYDVVISGMGPTALAAANEVAKRGKRVLVVSDRGLDFVRGQRVLLTLDVTFHLRSLRGNSDFIDSIPVQEKNNNVAIKDAERYLFETANALREQGYCIDFLFESELAEATLKDGVVAIRSKTEKDSEAVKKVEFNFLLGADGIGRHALHVLNRDNQLPEIQVVETPSKYNPNHATINLTVKMKDGSPFHFPENKAHEIFFPDMRITGICFDLASNRKSHYRSIKCSFTCEIPKELKAIEDKDDARNAFLEIVRAGMQETFAKNNLPGEIELVMPRASMKHGEYKDRIQYGLFGTKDIMLTQAAAEREGKIYASAGDVISNSDYRSGVGLNNGIRNAIAFARLVDKEISVEEYNRQCAMLIDRMKEFLQKNNLQIFEEVEEQASKEAEVVLKKY